MQVQETSTIAQPNIVEIKCLHSNSETNGLQSHAELNGLHSNAEPSGLPSNAETNGLHHSRSPSPIKVPRGHSSSREEGAPAGAKDDASDHHIVAGSHAEQPHPPLPPGYLPSRASAGALTAEEESEGYLNKARSYIEGLGGSFDPAGWSVSISVRTSGASAGTHDRYLHAPDGTRLRSLPELARHLGLIALSEDAGPTSSDATPLALGPSLSGRERRPVNRLVASEELDQPQLASKKVPPAPQQPTVVGLKREFVDPEELMDGPRRRKLPNGAWEKLPPRRALLGTSLGSMEGPQDTQDASTESEPDRDPTQPTSPVIASGAPPEQFFVGMPNDMQVPVVCGGKEATLYYPSRTVLCSCSECSAKPFSDRIMRCTAFETHGGRGSAKKWMDSVLVRASDAVQLCGKLLPKVKVYLKAKGVDLSSTKPGTGQPAGKDASEGPATTRAKVDVVAGSRPSSSSGKSPLNSPSRPGSGQPADARKLVQWAIRRKRSNTSPEDPPTPSSVAGAPNDRYNASPTAQLPAGMNLTIPPHLQPPQTDTGPGALHRMHSPGASDPPLPSNSIMQPPERMAYAHKLNPRQPAAAANGSTGNQYGARDPRIASPPSPASAGPGARRSLPAPRRPSAGQSRAPFGSRAMPEAMAAEAKQAAGGPELTAPQSRAHIDELMQSLSQALSDNRVVQENAMMAQLADLQARHDSQSMELMAEIRTLTMRVSELEENNTSLLRALKDAQASSAQRHVSPQHHVSAAPPPAGPPAPAVAPPVPQQPSSPIAMQQPLHTAGQLTRAPASMQGPASIQAQPGPEYAMTPASPSTGIAGNA